MKKENMKNKCNKNDTVPYLPIHPHSHRKKYNGFFILKSCAYFYSDTYDCISQVKVDNYLI